MSTTDGQTDVMKLLELLHEAGIKTLADIFLKI
jgi:hypothetical protein